MRDWLSSLFYGPSEPDVPWLHTPSIYAHIESHLDPATGKLREEGISLPDEERRYANTQLRWAPGAMDGAFGHHAGANNDPDIARQVASHVIDIARRDALQSKVALYELLFEDNLLDFIDLAVEQIVQAGISPRPHLHNFAAFLVRDAPDRGPVKFGIALLGLIGDVADKETVLLLGKHEEFTLYAAVALTNMLEDPEAALWDLAQAVEGWGRIHLVERLASSDSSQIKDWLLREGYRNSIMYEYLAYTCATAGNLRAALSGEDVDDELLDAAGELVEALIAGGPAEDIDDYADAADVVSRYLELVEPRAVKLAQFSVVDTVLRYLTDDGWDDGRRAQNGWDNETRVLAVEAAHRICQHPRWPAIVARGLASDDDLAFYLADRAATSLGIDTWEAHWGRLQVRPHDGQRWYQVMQRATPHNIEAIVCFALEALPLDEVATGAADELGLGTAYAIHGCLDTIVQGLRDHPFIGWPLVAAALKSPVVRNRNMAIQALAAWGRDRWTPEIEQALVDALQAEPVQDVRGRMEELLRGEPLG
jgi:hypothetical protein